MVDIVVMKCDVCGTLDEVERIQLNGTPEAQIDLCALDRQRLLEALSGGRASNPPKKVSEARRSKPAKRAASKKRVMTLDEIEALKN